MCGTRTSPPSNARRSRCWWKPSATSTATAESNRRVDREKGEGRREKGEGRREKGEGRREKGEEGFRLRVVAPIAVNVDAAMHYNGAMTHSPRCDSNRKLLLRNTFVWRCRMAPLLLLKAYSTF